MRKIFILMATITLLTACWIPKTQAFDFGKCINTINSKVQKISGYDPRVLARQCAWEMISKGKKPAYMEKCMIKGLKRNVKNIRNPEHFAKNIVNSVKKKCR